MTYIDEGFKLEWQDADLGSDFESSVLEMDYGLRNEQLQLPSGRLKIDELSQAYNAQKSRVKNVSEKLKASRTSRKKQFENKVLYSPTLSILQQIPKKGAARVHVADLLTANAASREIKSFEHAN